MSCGRTWLEQKIVVVDPATHKECPFGHVGEIWVSGQSMAQGYWKRVEETRETFQAHVAGTGKVHSCVRGTQDF